MYAIRRGPETIAEFAFVKTRRNGTLECRRKRRGRAVLTIAPGGWDAVEWFNPDPDSVIEMQYGVALEHGEEDGKVIAIAECEAAARRLKMRRGGNVVQRAVSPWHATTA